MEEGSPTNNLPAEGFVREPEACRFAGVNRTTLWRWQKAGCFPKPRRIGVKAVAWSVADLRAWAEAREYVR